MLIATTEHMFVIQSLSVLKNETWESTSVNSADFVMARLVSTECQFITYDVPVLKGRFEAGDEVFLKIEERVPSKV